MSKLKEIYCIFIRKILGPVFREVRQYRIENQELNERIVRLEQNIRKNNERIVGLEQNIRKNNERLNSLERAVDENRLVKLENNVRSNNGQLSKLRQNLDEIRLVKVEENIRKNNQRINDLEKLNTKLEMNLVKIKSSINRTAEPGLKENKSDVKKEDSLKIINTKRENAYSKIDYFDFENHFRGSCQNVKERQKMYVPYFAKCRNVLDIGCGRGEFLELLKENNISARGVDLYPEYVEYCHMKDLDVICDDGIHYLMGCGKVDGIMAAQLVEHLDVDQIVTLCEAAYDHLTEDGILIMETPNPKVLAIYVNEFYMDPSHIKPVHPETLKYLAEKSGFREVEILYTESSRINKAIAELKVDASGNLKEFNSSLKEVSELLYGSRDYAVIARKLN